MAVLDSRRTCSVKSTISIRRTLYDQLQLTAATSHYYNRLQQERFVQPLLQSGTLLVSTPVQLIRF